jgi:hypothetical protein
MKWFRFYGEVLNDPKAQCLDGETFKFWVNCLCVASQNGGELPALKPLAFLLRSTPEACAEPLKILVASSLIDEVKNQHGVTHYVHGWDKRQYKSDTSTERVKRFRNDHVTANETPPEQIQITDTDTEQKRKKEASRKREPVAPKILVLDGFEYTPDQLFEILWRDFPDISTKGNKSKAREKFYKQLNNGADHEGIITGARRYRDFCKAEGQFNQHCSTWVHQRGWEGEWAPGTGRQAAAKPSARSGAGYSLQAALDQARHDKTRRPEGREERLASLGIGADTGDV